MLRSLAIVFALTLFAITVRAAEPPAAPKAFIDGSGPGWRALGELPFNAA